GGTRGDGGRTAFSGGGCGDPEGGGRTALHGLCATGLGQRAVRLGLGVEVLQAARFDAGGVDETVDIGLLEPDDAPELVRRQLTFVDEAIERPQGYPEPLRGFLGAHPPY